MATALIIPPAATPVSLLEVKRHLRIETDSEDDYLLELISASTSHLEKVAELKLISQTWRQYMDCLPENSTFKLEINPVQSVLEMRVFDPTGNADTISPDQLELDAVSTPARLLVKQPLATSKHFNGIEIDIVAGFGETSVDVPDGLRRALLLLIAHAYEFRGAVPAALQPASEPHGFRTLIAPYRRVHL